VPIEHTLLIELHYFDEVSRAIAIDRILGTKKFNGWYTDETNPRFIVFQKEFQFILIEGGRYG
jgi:hypothetical protein